MKILIIYNADCPANTVYEHLNAFHKYSCHQVKYTDSRSHISIDQLNSFDAIVIHYTVSMFIDRLMSPMLRWNLSKTSAKKIVFIQDEYRRVNDVIELLDILKIDCLFTCVPTNEIEKVYPKEKLPNLLKINNLTGYVSEDLLRSTSNKKYSDRLLDVVYRARKLSAWYGTLCYDKWRIADDFNLDAKKYNLKVDISALEKDRLYGDQWQRFLENSKAALGVESGANVFDFTGEIQVKVEAYEAKNPDASYHEVKEIFIKDLDEEIKINQISPRCFECAAFKTLMILYEGEYSGILKPWRHYVPLKKDHSNMDTVVEYLRDEKKWQFIVENAYREVAMNPAYSYKTLIQMFDKVLQEQMDIVDRLDDEKKKTESENVKLAFDPDPKEKTVFNKLLSTCGYLLTPWVKDKVLLCLNRLTPWIRLYLNRFLLLKICTHYALKYRNPLIYKNLFDLQHWREPVLTIAFLKYLNDFNFLFLQTIKEVKLENSTMNMSIGSTDQSVVITPDVLCRVKKLHISSDSNFFIPESLRGKSFVLHYPKFILEPL